MKTILVISVLVAASVAVYYFIFYKQGKINDRDGDFIPDEVEDAIEEVKSRAKEVRVEVEDVVKEIKDVVEQSKDVVNAAKGKKRRGRKPKNKK
jgi:hypothetical protein